MFRLKELRTEYGLKRSQLAKDLEINAGTIANYENGLREAPYDYIIKFADYFDVTVDYLLGRTDGEDPPHLQKPPTGAEAELLKLYRAAGRIGKNRILEYAEMWRDRGE